jgi:hypothetical protein
MGLIFVVCPDFANGTGWLDRRFAQMGFILLLVALRPELPVHLAPALAGLMLVMVLGRTAWVGTVWWQRAADVASVTRALAAVPPGALVLPLEHSSDAGKTPIGRTFIDGFPAYLHLPTLAIPQRQAFVPTLFTARGKQPLAVRPAFQDLSVPEGGLAPVNALDHLDRFSALRLTTPYLEHWRRFDYVLVLNADMPDLRGPVTLPRELELLRDEGFAQLYRIRHEAVAAKD